MEITQDKSITYLNTDEKTVEPDILLYCEVTSEEYDKFKFEEDKLEISNEEEIFRLALIEAVKKRPTIYDDALRKNAARLSSKDVEWLEISNETGYPVLTCFSTWQTVKRHFVSVHKQKQEGKPVTWKFASHLEWLAPYACKDETNDEKAFKMQLIDIIRDKYPQLYDVNHPEYSLASKIRNRFWDEVGKEVNCPAKVCQTTWSDLRARYVNNKSKTSTNAVFGKKLEFLIPFVGARSRLVESSKIKTPDQIEDENFKKNLAAIVKNFPQLYDKVLLSKKFERDAIWIEISERVKYPPAKCRSTWTVLRHHYGSLWRRRKLGETVTWKFESDFNFLLPHVLDTNSKEDNKKKLNPYDEYRKKLITVVKKKPEIYNSNMKKYTRSYCFEMWGKVAEEMGRSAEECRQTWAALRSQYAKLMRRKTINPTWKFYEDIKFIEPHIKSQINHSDGLRKQLIEVIKSYPKIYTNDNDMQPDETEDWDTIGEKLDRPGSDCKYVWSILKIAYKRVLIEKQIGIDRQWQFEDDMEFLLPFIKTDNIFIDGEETCDIFNFRNNLIRLVEKYPIIYNIDYVEDTNNITAEYAWNDIACELKMPVRKCCNVWQRLVNAFHQILDRQKKDLCKETELTDRMKFITPYLNKLISKDDQDTTFISEDEFYSKYLIEAVKDYPILYNIKCKQLKKAYLNDKLAWVEISQDIGLTEEACFRLWDKLITTYKENVLNTNRTDEDREWKYQNYMEFMRYFLLDEFGNLNTSITLTQKETDKHEVRIILLNAIRRNQAIYDIDHEDHKKSTILSKLWNNISKEVGYAVPNCRSNWQLLKKKFIKMTKEKDKNLEKWRYAHHMDFMLPIARKIIENEELAEMDFDTGSNEYRKQLIKIIKSCPEIYDNKRSLLTHHKKRFKHWLKVSEELGRSVVECRNDWMEIKRSYMKSLVHGQYHSICEGLKLDFLKPFLQDEANFRYSRSSRKKVKKGQKQEEFKRDLILLIKEYPAIYKSDLIEQDNEILIENSWREIAAKLPAPIRKCKYVWSHLKTVFKDIRSQKDLGSREKWKFEDDMEFYIPFVDTDCTDYSNTTVSHDKYKFKQKLIGLVRENPTLYNPSHADYARRHIVSEIWANIGKTLGVTARRAAAIWRTVKRDLYKLYKNDKLKNGDRLQYLQFCEDMKFMLEFLNEPITYWGFPDGPAEESLTNEKSVSSDCFAEFKNKIGDSSSSEVQDSAGNNSIHSEKSFNHTGKSLNDPTISFLKLSYTVTQLPASVQKDLQSRIFRLCYKTKNDIKI